VINIAVVVKRQDTFAKFIGGIGLSPFPPVLSIQHGAGELRLVVGNLQFLKVSCDQDCRGLEFAGVIELEWPGLGLDRAHFLSRVRVPTL
jgi:hypothetical protein